MARGWEWWDREDNTIYQWRDFVSDTYGVWLRGAVARTAGQHYLQTAGDQLDNFNR